MRVPWSKRPPSVDVAAAERATEEVKRTLEERAHRVTFLSKWSENQLKVNGISADIEWTMPGRHQQGEPTS